GVFRADFRDGGWAELFSIRFGNDECAEVSRDGGKLVVLGSDGVLVCWDVAAGKELWRAPKTGRLFAISPDSRTVVVNPAAGDRLQRRDAITGKVIADDRLPPRLPPWGALEWMPRFALRFTPDGKG